MLHLVLCFTVWALIFTFLGWRLIEIAKQAVNHLKRLHQIPCCNCAYYTGDHRLKCTVNPVVAMSETAIGCRDFISKTNTRDNNYQKPAFSGCIAGKKYSNTEIKPQKTLFKLKFTHITNENISFDSTSLD